MLAFIGRLICFMQQLINRYLFSKRKYPRTNSSKRYDDNHTLVNWNIHKGYNNFYMYNLENVMCCLADVDADHLCLEEVQSIEQANYIKYNLKYNDMVFYNGLCFLTNKSIKSTTEIKMKNNANALKIKIREKEGSRDYYNIYLIHLTSDISQQTQSEEMEQLIGYLQDETELENEKLILLGDFNINHNKFDDELKQKFNLINYVNEATFPCLYPFLK